MKAVNLYLYVNNMNLRGRIQAQGKNLEESEAWSQNEPLTEAEGLKKLEKLKNKIPKKEAEIRISAFKKAKKYIQQASENGGLFAQSFATFNVKGKSEERIDIEVREGIAFVPDLNKNNKK